MKSRAFYPVSWVGMVLDYVGDGIDSGCNIAVLI